MQPHRLSFGTVGAPAPPHRDPPHALRQPQLARVPAGLEVSLAYGRHERGQARRRRLAIVALTALHGLAILALVNGRATRDVPVETPPVFLAVLDGPTPPAPPKALPPPPMPKAPPPPVLQMPLIAPEPAPSTSPLVAQVAVPAPPAPAVEATQPPAPPVAPAVRALPASSVQFLVPPAPVYSRISYRMRESGKAIVRVFIDEAGLPREVQVATSSGFARLDDSAVAAVRAARFKPCLENGVAVAGWAFIPIEFALPQ